MKPLPVLSERPPAWAGLPASVVRKLLLFRMDVVRGLALVLEVRPPGAVALLAAAEPVVCELDCENPAVRPFPKVTCWPERVPVQSIPLAELMFFWVSMI